MKVLTIILTIMMIFTLCSCSNDTPAKEDLVPIDTDAEQESVQDENEIESHTDSDALTKKEPVPTEDEFVEVVTVVEDKIIEAPPLFKPDTSLDEDTTEHDIPVDIDVPSNDIESEDTEIEPDDTMWDNVEDEPTTKTENVVESAHEPSPEPKSEDTAEVIDTAALEAYGRSYAASTYGYWGNPSTGFSSNAGYFPPTYVIINTMEDGYRYAREVIDAQYYDDIAAGQPITAEIDGVTVRRKINIYFQTTDDPNMFLLYCFYGGE